MEHLITIKILPETYQLLRMVAALRRESQYRVLARLLQAEADQALTEKCGQLLHVKFPTIGE
jgi:hypothetical protein